MTQLTETMSSITKNICGIILIKHDQKLPWPINSSVMKILKKFGKNISL